MTRLPNSYLRTRSSSSGGLDRVSDDDPSAMWSWLAGLILFFFASCPNVLLVTSQVNSTGTSSGASVTFYAIAMLCYALSAIGIAVRLRGHIVPLFRAWPVWALVAFAFISCTWSVVPSFTLSRSIAFLGTTLSAGLVATFPKSRQLAMVTWVGGAILVISMIMAVATPELGVMEYEGQTAVRGIYVHKNMLGWCTNLFFVFAWGAYQARAVKRIWASAVICLAVAAMIMSKSSSSIVGAIIAGCIFLTLSVVRRAGKARAMILLCLMLIMIVLIVFVPILTSAILESMGKTITLSGRISLWEALIPAIQDKALLGWGFGGAIWDSPLGADFLKYVFYEGNAQGGHVENLINIGIVGCLLFYIPYLSAMSWNFRNSILGDNFSLTMFCLLFTLAFLGVTAPILLGVNQLPWILIALPYFERTGLYSFQSKLSQNSSRPALASG